MLDYDIAIIGAGPAGAASAVALAQQGLQVALLDRQRPAPLEPDAALDPRVVAISPGSMQLLDQIGARDYLQTERLAEYRSMQVCARLQSLEFIAAEHGLDQLGWIVEIANVASAIWQTAEREKNLDLLTPAEVDTFELQSDMVRFRLTGGRELSAGILIGADGARSQIRTIACIEHDVHDYNQRAIVTHLDTIRANHGIAWQRFTDHGPLALLPLPEGRSSLVWSVPFERAQTLMTLDERAFLDQLELAAADSPFGGFTSMTQRHAIPLIRRQSKQMHQGRVALLGDAARSVHPLAGQGMNLGLADAAELTTCLNGWSPEINPHTRLARYARRRLSDSSLIAEGIHLINESRSFGSSASQFGIGIAFRLLSNSRLARGAFVKMAIGL